MIFRISLARVEIAVESLYDEVYKMCIPYLSSTSGTPDFTVRTTEADIDFERRKSSEEARREGREAAVYEKPYLETLAVYRRIAVGMLNYHAFLMHGSAVGVDGEAWLFTAASGVGKTTHTRLWMEYIPGAFVINGDKPLIRLGADKVLICGTPWSGKEGWNQNTVRELNGVVFLERGTENAIEPVDYLSVLPRLLQQTYRPQEAEALQKTMGLVRELGTRMRFYRLKCNMKPDATLVAWEGLHRT